MVFFVLCNRLTYQIKHFAVYGTTIKLSKTFQFCVCLRINSQT